MPAAVKTTASKVAAAKKEAGRKGPAHMTDEHKASLAKGRTESRTVSKYLAVIDTPRRRGRQRTPESIDRRLKDIDSKLDTAEAGQRLLYLQERKDLLEERARLAASSPADLSELEAEFIKVAADFGERKGISYSTWREAGVSADVLAKAGIARTRG